MGIAAFFKNVVNTCGKFAVETAVGLPGNILGDTISDIIQNAVNKYTDRHTLNSVTRDYVKSLECVDILGAVAEECVGKKYKHEKDLITEFFKKLLALYSEERNSDSAIMEGFLAKSETYNGLTPDDKALVRDTFHELRKHLLDQQFKKIGDDDKVLYHCIESLLDPKAFAEEIAKKFSALDSNAQVAEVVKSNYSFTYIKHECPGCHTNNVRYNPEKRGLLCVSCGDKFTLEPLEQNWKDHLSKEHFDKAIKELEDDLKEVVEGEGEKTRESLDNMQDKIEKQDKKLDEIKNSINGMKKPDPSPKNGIVWKLIFSIAIIGLALVIAIVLFNKCNADNAGDDDGNSDGGGGGIESGDDGNVAPVWQINNSTATNFMGYVGETYKITAANNVPYDISKYNITVTENYPTVNAEDLALVGSDGSLKLVGVGKCEVWIRSATDASDKGVKFQVTSSIRNKSLGTAINEAFSEKLGSQQNNAITQGELAAVKSLKFFELKEFDESELKVILPALDTVVYDLSNGSYEDSKQFKLGTGSIKYHFIGSEDKVYALSVTTAQRKDITLTFENISLASKGVDCIDVSNANNASINFIGICEIKASDAFTSGDGYIGIKANGLDLILHQYSNVTISGGTGTSSSYSGTRNGGVGVFATEISIDTLSDKYDAHLLICGGNGGNAYSLGASGGDGALGVQAETVGIYADLFCNIVGGSGGNGKKGADSTVQGETGWCRTLVGQPRAGTGGQGGTGSDGGAGGNGADAFVGTITVKSGTCKLIGGVGGDGAAGGKGGKGGTGGGNTAWNNFEGTGGTGHGGQGGTGGVGGDAGHGGKNTQVNYSVSPTAVFKIILGDNGVVGEGGEGGEPGDPGTPNQSCPGGGQPGEKGDPGADGTVRAS